VARREDEVVVRAADLTVLHIVYSYPPDPPGGTEVYVHELCRHLRERGVTSVVVAPGAADVTHLIDGVRVRRFAWAGKSALEDIYGMGDARAADAFERILAEEAPDLVHQHALTPACSVEVAERVKASGRPLVFTYHTPTVSCVRGTLLRWGREVCDGRLDAGACSACLLDSHGVPEGVGRVVSAVGVVVGTGLEVVGAAGGAFTALRMPMLVRRQHDALRRLFSIADAVVAPAPWVRDLLIGNGVATDRIVLSRHGVAAETTVRPRTRSERTTLVPPKLVHLGRMDATKGTGLLLDAMAQCANAAIELDIYGVSQGSGSQSLLESLESQGRRDPRVRFLAPIPHDQVIPTLTAYDAVVVPSQWLETGPLVVLEAFAAGVPVIGSDLGGIAEKVRDGVDGVLVRPFDSAARWAEVLTRVAAEPQTIRALSQNVRRPRPTEAVADEMLSLYGRLTSRQMFISPA
jgi:glycosyltransferase involved in cell wall biosynthesis